MLQTPGAAYGAWPILDALLAATGPGTPFIFTEPLGQAREVKVALSGLFGRFVARAYLERYLDLSIFAHLTSRSLHLDGRRRIDIVRRSRGDLPDWVACAADLTSLTVAEAKGCHDPGGPDKALTRGWAQAQRIDVTARGRKVTIKRVAIATRWGAASSGPAQAYLSVRDPVDEASRSMQRTRMPSSSGCFVTTSPTSLIPSAMPNSPVRFDASLASAHSAGFSATSRAPRPSGCCAGAGSGRRQCD